MVKLENVSRFYGSFPALKEVTLSLPFGRIGLLGPNGAGKSTLIKILLGLLAPSSGHGTILDIPLSSSGAKLRRKIGYVPESHSLVPGLKGVEYVSMAGELAGMQQREAQRRAHELLTYLELEDARYRPLEDFSTGMKQRIKLAQALIHDPPLLLLDEPTSGLDPAGRDAMLRLLHVLGTEHGKAFILCTHLLGDVDRICDYVVILHHGEVLRQGKVEELRSKRQNRYRLKIEGNPEKFLKDLRLEDVEVLEDNAQGDVLVQVPADWVTRAFFQLADNNDVILKGIRKDVEDLSQLFHRALAEREPNGN